MTLSADVHYKVARDDYGEIRTVACNFCNYAETRMENRRGSDKSGRSAYNRMRGKLVKHIHANHKVAAEAALRAAREEK